MHHLDGVVLRIGASETRPTQSVFSDAILRRFRRRGRGPAGYSAGMPNYRRVWVPGGTYFFTVNLLERRRTLLVDHVSALRDAFRAVRIARPFELLAIVVLPDHLHCIWRLPAGDADNATRRRYLKRLFSQRLPRTERLSAQRVRRKERGIWQRRFWERSLRDDRDVRQHVDYIHYNPVKHRHVQRVADWPWSSFHRYTRLGLLPRDWRGTKS